MCRLSVYGDIVRHSLHAYSLLIFSLQPICLGNGKEHTNIYVCVRARVCVCRCVCVCVCVCTVCVQCVYSVYAYDTVSQFYESTAIILNNYCIHCTITSLE